MPDWLPRDISEAVLFTPLRIVFLVVVAIIARVVICRLIDKLADSWAREPRKELLRAASRLRVPGARQAEQQAAERRASDRRAQRLRALAGLARSVVTVFILVVTVLIILSELNFNITTLVAGTSIVGVTIAFGLQNVVKDFVSGVFLLVEDQIGVDDWVQLEQVGGTGVGQVIDVGFRVTTLRQTDGTLCIVRNGEVIRVLNHSQGGPDRLPPDDSTPQPDEPEFDSASPAERDTATRKDPLN
ncbi:mechanosensitive ion channel family protein [Propionibacteriaceae bacterium Y1700]|uniref:mechanosensitive ion channel family protein n=1 Tax=Microlunatus sp. Y1700 TaxID=3418487 RepID=UPI003DA6D346